MAYRPPTEMYRPGSGYTQEATDQAVNDQSIEGLNRAWSDALARQSPSGALNYANAKAAQHRSENPYSIDPFLGTGWDNFFASLPSGGIKGMGGSWGSVQPRGSIADNPNSLFNTNPDIPGNPGSISAGAQQTQGPYGFADQGPLMGLRKAAQEFYQKKYPSGNPTGTTGAS